MINKALETVFTLISIVGVGVLISYLGWYGPDHKSFLSKLIINVSVPCIAIKNMLVTFTRKELFQSGNLVLTALIGILSVLAISSLLGKILRLDGDRMSGFVTLCSLGNTMFIGLPVASSLLGEESIPYVMIFYMVGNILLWLVFAPMFRPRNKNLALKDKLKERLSNLISIPLIAMLISIILLIFGVKLPDIIIKPISSIGGMGTPLALIFIGGVVYEVGLRNIRFGIDSLFVNIVRFIISPVLIFFLAKNMGMGNLEVQTFTLLAGMPGMTQVGVISATYSDDSEFVMSNIVITTLVSLIFIPACMAIMPKYL